MNFTQFTDLLARTPNGVILLEGRRDIPKTSEEAAQDLADKLARCFPQLRFRSGNATGSDESFAEGVAAVDASRLQIVLPYESHRIRSRFPGAAYTSPESCPPDVLEKILHKTVEASPQNKGLIAKRHRNRQLAVKADYLIRDTLKVLGNGADVPKPICALFYVNPEDPMEGGTGHTIRVCRMEGVPVVFQNDWETWTL